MPPATTAFQNVMVDHLEALPTLIGKRRLVVPVDSLSNRAVQVKSESGRGVGSVIDFLWRLFIRFGGLDELISNRANRVTSGPLRKVLDRECLKRASRAPFECRKSS